MLKRFVTLFALGILTSTVGYARAASAQAYVNSMSYARTTNYAHRDGYGQPVVYEYRLASGNIDYSLNGGGWQPLKVPQEGMLFKNIAADHNRLFALTTDNRLFWYVPMTDYAEWVEKLCEAACDLNWGWLNAKLAPYLDGHTACDYKKYVVNTHQAGSWNELLRLNGKQRGYPGPDDEFDRSTILDIAVGHWYGTVVTYYVLVKTPDGAKIMFTDEEPLLPKWVDLVKKDEYIFPKPPFSGIERDRWGLKWTKLKEDYQLRKQPTGLTAESRIDASNSVLALSTREGDTGAKIWWLRFDFHHQPLFGFWPVLDWDEAEWSSRSFPGGDPTRFAINTNGTFDPGKDQGPWKRPHFKVCWLSFGGDCLVESETSKLKGMFGSIERWDIYNYPLVLTVATEVERATVFANQRTHKKCRPIKWINWLKVPCNMQAIGLLGMVLDSNITFDNHDDHPVGPVQNQPLASPSRWPGQYEFINWSMSWTGAKDYCERHDALLVKPISISDFKIVKAVAGPAKHTWIGVHKVDDVWRWVDNQEITTPTNWAREQPDNAGGNEIYVEAQSSGAWNDLPPDWVAKLVCEMDDGM